MNDSQGIVSKLLEYGIEVGLLISGFFGSLLLVSKDASQRLGTTIASLLAGTACANYLTPVVLGLLPEGARLQGKYATAFMLGFMGLKGLELMIYKVTRHTGLKANSKPKPRKKRRKI